MSRRTLVLIAIVLGTALVAVGAGAVYLMSGRATPYELRIEEKGAALTGPQAEQLAASTDIAALASVAATDAVTMRATVLIDLRTRGPLGELAADLLTSGFPERTAAVPVLVRACAVDGVDSVLVVEAFGSEGGTLTHRRLWVFDRASGAILRAASFR